MNPIQRVVDWSVGHRTLVLVAGLVFAAFAAILGARLKLDALPDITNNQVLVLTRAPGLTPEEVERRVTRPVEVLLGGLPGLSEQRSLSRYGISSITVVFDDDVDPYRARQLVQERLNSAAGAIPPGVDPPELGPVTGGLGEIFHFTLRSPSRTPAELLEMVQFRVAPLLRSVSGVVEVNTWGGQQRTLDVIADPVRLAQRGITLDRLREALSRATGTAPGASLPAGTGQTLLRVVSQPRSPSELGQVMVSASDKPDAPGIRLADVADVREGAAPRIGAATADGHGETIYVMAQMLRGANALEVMGGVHEKMTELRAVLPEDVQIDLVYDRSILVNQTLRTLSKNLVEGAILVVAVLFLMLGSLRAGLLVASVIPLSMLGATLGMVALDIPGNLMSLGAIDFGLVVDGAVVMVEHVFHTLHHARPHHGVDPDAGRRLGDRIRPVVLSVASPVFFSVLVILLVYVPVLSLTGVDGKMFRPMALTVVFALLTSLVLALTFVPAGAAAFLRPRDIPDRDPPLVRAIQRGYEPLLALCRRAPWGVASGAALLLLLGIFLYARAGSEFAPQLDEGDMVVQTTRAPDISLEQAVREGGRMEAALIESVPEVRQVVSRIGNPAVATDIMGLEQADVFVRLKPRDEWREGLSREELIEQMRSVIDARAPGSDPSFTQPIQMRFNELLGGAVTDVAVSVYGEDLGELRRLAERVRDVVKTVPGAVDVRVLAPPDVALLEVRPLPLAASQRGFAVADILDAVQAVRQGVPVGSTYDGPVRVPIVLRLAGAKSAFDLAELPLPSASGGLVPLARVADVRFEKAPSLVSHQGGERRLVVGFNVRGADLGDVVVKAEAKVRRDVPVPRGFRLRWGGQYETLQSAARRLQVVIPIVIVLILAVLLIAFRKIKPTLLIFLNVPFACVGGMIALALRGMPVSISAAVGFIALSGVAVLNGVVLMSRVLSEEASGRRPAEAAAVAARARARPVLMTALVAALGFLPMMLARGVGAEVQRPLASVVVGGLVTSTILTLIILPTLYPWVSWRRKGRA